MLFFKKKKKGKTLEDKLDEPLLYLSNSKKDALSTADFLEGGICMGSTGAGKSSGPGRKIAKALLKKGYGGLVLCAKPGERATWVRYAKETGREKDLVIFDERSGFRFNPLEYELTRHGRGAGETLNLVNLIMSIYELGTNYQAGGSGGSENERFWDNSLRRGISRAIDLLKIAQEPVSIYTLRKIFIEAFTEEDVETYARMWSIIEDEGALERDRNLNLETFNRWKASNYFLHCFTKANSREDLTKEEKSQFQTIGDYYFKVFPALSEKTKSIVVESFLGLAEPFLGTGILKNHFSEGVSDEVRPEWTYLKNKVVIIDFPIKDYHLSGIYAAGSYKLIWQQAMERRRIEEEENPNVAFLYVDESQNFINPAYDTLFQTTARGSLIASIYLTQNINNYFFTMGKENPEARAKSLLSNLGISFLCCQSDYDTNKWAAEKIGQDFIDLSSETINANQGGSKTYSKKLHFKVPPHYYTTLKTGRKTNNYIVEAIVFKLGRKWSNNQNYLLASFNQKD